MATATPYSLPNTTLIGSDLGYLVLGVVFVAIGVITLLLPILRSASRDKAIFLFGAMSSLWGIRFLLYTQVIPLLLTDNPQALLSLARSFTYFGATAAFGLIACEYAISSDGVIILVNIGSI